MIARGAIRRVTAAAATIALSLALAGMSGAQAAAPSGSSQARVLTPLIEVGSASAFSPNGDHRKDRLRIGFKLAAPARVIVTVRDIRERVRRTVRLGRLAVGRHDWTWDGRGDRGAVVADGLYHVGLRAATGRRSQSDEELVGVDTLSPRGTLVTSRPTAYPVASAVRDHVKLAWMLDNWNPAADEMDGEEDKAARVRLDIRTGDGRLVWRKTASNIYTPVFDWYARRDSGRALPPGRYVARVRVRDFAGNRSQGRADLRVSHAQLVERLWTHTVAAAKADRYYPFYGSCLGCGDFCAPVPSERFVDGLSFGPCTYWSWAQASFAADVPFAAAPVDTYRITAAGGPTTPGSADEARFGDGLGPGDDTATTPWLNVVLSHHPFFPTRTRPVTWEVQVNAPNSYDIATFTVEYRHYVPATESDASHRGKR